MAAVALATRMDGGGPCLFRDERIGHGNRPFVLYKFRTMRDLRDAEGRPLPDEVRLTRIGSALRALSLDELPQLWNVLRGDMSLVGPRPLPVRYLSRYTADQIRRHDVPPGITGWVQVICRNELSWDEKFALDLWYVDHWSLWLDVRILWRTASRVLKREGIAHAQCATMPEFAGAGRAENEA